MPRNRRTRIELRREKERGAREQQNRKKDEDSERRGTDQSGRAEFAEDGRKVGRKAKRGRG